MDENKELLEKYLTEISGGMGVLDEDDNDDDTEINEGLKEPYGVFDPNTGLLLDTFATLTEAQEYVAQNFPCTDDTQIWDPMKNIRIMLTSED